MSTRTLTTVLPIPGFYKPDTAGTIWQVPYGERAQQARDWAIQHNIKPAASDKTKIGVLLIDMQNTFCVKTGELFVGGRSGNGAVEDSRRLCEFLYRNLAAITAIFPTMDTHTAMQIFHEIFLVDDNGNHPAPFTLVQYDEVMSGKWKVNPQIVYSLAEQFNVPISGVYQMLQQQLVHYTKKLSESGKYALTIWPYHAMLGGVGHALVSAVHEAEFFHTIARSSQTGYQIKGGNPLTENYSILRPEVMDGPNGGSIGAQKNARFISQLLRYDKLIIAGQAASHCLAWTIADLLTEINTVDPKLAEKVYILRDCTSPVVIPGIIDYTQQTEEAFKRFEDAGMHLVNSTEPIADWPGM